METRKVFIKVELDLCNPNGEVTDDMVDNFLANTTYDFPQVKGNPIVVEDAYISDATF